MAYKKGQELYRVYTDDEDGRCECDLFRVSSIRKNRVYAIIVIDGLTWGKRSRKHGDFGFLKNIPEYCREVCFADHGFRDLYTTRLQAWKAELKSINKWLRERGVWELTAEAKVQYTKGHRTCERMVKKYSRKRVNG